MNDSTAARSPVASRILEIAGGLFFREGIRAVGVDRIIAEAATTKATLYRHFPSKEDLVLAYLDERDRQVMAGLIEICASARPPRERLAEIFDRLAQKAENPEFRGCAFGLAVAEHGDSPRIIEAARRHKTAVTKVLTGIAAQAGLADPAGAGQGLALLYDGALARRAVFGTAEPMHQARDWALRILDAG